MTKMYGLFACSYNYYKWEDIICVSEDVDKLINAAIEYITQDHYVNDYTLDVITHEDWESKEKKHFYIKEVTAL